MSERTPPRLPPGEPTQVALKVHGRYQLATITTSNGRPDLNPVRQLAKQLGISRKQALRLYEQTMQEQSRQRDLDTLIAGGES